MADSVQVRLVRCPKCENLLSEPTDYSVYQCGGCGAVLRAKKRNPESDTLWVKSEESVGVVSTKLEDFSDKEIPENLYDGVASVLSDASETDAKSNSNELGSANMGANNEELKPQVGNASWSGRASGWEVGERREMKGFWRNPITDVEGVRFSTSNYQDEGSSNCYPDSNYGHVEAVNNRNELEGSNRVECLEQDRAELLRQLNELDDKLSRSCNVIEKPNGKVPLDTRMGHPGSYGGSDTWFPDHSSGSYGGSMHLFATHKHIARPYNSNYLGPEPYPYVNRHDMAMHPSLHTSEDIRGYGDPFRSQMLRRVPHQAPCQYPQQLSHSYSSGHYIDAHPNLVEPYPHHASFHHPSCSCFHCYEKHQVPGAVPRSTFGEKRFPHVPNNPLFYHQNPGAFDPRVYNPGVANPPPLSFHDPRPQTRWLGNLNSKMSSGVHSHPRNVMLPKGGRHCRPIAGGAPFVACYNCFELLQLPRKVLLTDKNQRKMLCGACSMVICYAVVDKKIVISAHEEPNQTSKKIDNSFNKVVNGSTSHSQGHVNRTSVNFFSDDYDNSGYKFPSMDGIPTSSSTGQDLNSSKSQETQSLHSSSPTTSEDENRHGSFNTPRDVTNSDDPPMKASLSLRPPAGSPLQQHFDYSSNNREVERLVKGNQSSRSEQEKVMPKKATLRQNSVKDESVATEMEVSFNEYSNTGTSQDSGDVSKEEDKSRLNKGGESFFAGIIKKSFSRSSQVTESGRTSVTINGHAIPDRLIKKAEKLAGPIRPGEYWYDPRAGFWGVMGGRCLGIIPPYIEELNYRLSENCAGGNTGVFVNGRELHGKDFDLLVSRGLPSVRDRSYIVEISGRVLDEDSGEELNSLGRLAPTVEKAKRGFGMKVPRAAA